MSLLAVSGASAQSSALEPPDLERYLRWGPLRVRPTVELSQLGYDDNIFADNAQRESDFVTTVGPRLDGLLLVGHRAFVSFRNGVDFTLYRDNTEQNYTDYRNAARITFPWRSIGLFVEGEADRFRERPLDAQDIRAERDENELGVGLIFAPSERTEFELRHGVEQIGYTDPDELPGTPVTIGDRLDRHQSSYGGKLRYRLVGRTALTLETKFDRISFDDDYSRGRDSHVRSLLPGVDFGREGTLSGRLGVGLAEVDARDPIFKTVRETVARAEIVYRPNAQVALRLDGSRVPGFSLSDDSVTYLNSEAALEASYYFNRLIGFDLGSRRGTLEFPGSTAPTERKDRIQSYHGGLRLRISENALGRRVEYRLRVTRYRRDSTLDSEDQSRTTIGVNAVIGF